jgi:hypothetical protein
MAHPDRRHLILSGAAALAAAVLPRPVWATQTCVLERGVRLCHSRLSNRLRAQTTRRQNREQWCWAAALSMIFGYYGHPISQEKIVKDIWGRIVDVPRHVDDVMRDINRSWFDDRGRRFQVTGKRLTLHHIELPKQAARALEQNQPLIVGTLGHATVLTEMRWSIDADGQLFVSHLIVSDPADGSVRNLTLEERLLTAFVAAVDVRRS